MAYYSEDLIEEVISQNDIVEVISEYVQLKKSGRNHMGLCPFHREKTPSFCVSMDKQIYKCFGCSEGGNVISFVMKLENLDFWDSVELLAQRAHIELSRFEVRSSHNSVQAQKTEDLKEVLFKINREVGLYYHNNLMDILNSTGYHEVKEYIKKRKFDMGTIKKFGIGYANGKIPLYNYLLEKGFSKSDMLASGIIMENAKGKIYDRFFSRLMFPIFDIRDRTIAFGGRVLDNSLPKYVNSPENEIYFKGKNLYAMNLAKKEKLDNIIIVEGYMDAIALQKSGFGNAVASLGTALTENQARLIKKYTDNVIIGYDQDGAGQEATMRGLDILAAKKLNVKVLILDKPDAKDPDEYINKYGPERLKNCIQNSISLVEFKVKKLENMLDLNNIDSKIKFLTGVADIMAKIENDIERDLYIDKIARKYDIGSGPIIKEVEKRLQKMSKEDIVIDMQSINRKMQLVTNIRKRQEQYIVALILCKDKKIQDEIFEKIKAEDINDDNVRKIYLLLIDLKSKFDINKIDILSKVKEEDMIKELTEIMYIDLSMSDRNKLFQDVIKNKNKEKLFLRRDEILKRISSNITKDEKEILELELNQIIVELSKLK
ncbi:MAG: DNA primase [Clostridia bacterium]|nr:DNA primase [Clostridia bacterium]